MSQKRMIRRTIAALAVAAFCLATGSGCKKSPEVANVKERVEASTQKSAAWLKTQQNEDGTFGDTKSTQTAFVKIGLTSLATIALLDQDLDEKDPNVKRAVAFLAQQQKEDGSICVTPGTANYETALTSIALKKTGNAAYDSALEKAQTFLLQLQADSTKDEQINKLMDGGFGYGPKGFYDLSNTQFTLEALKTTELGADSEAFKRAVNFLQNCQNLKEYNEQEWVNNDGGFVYYPGGTRSGEDPKENESLRSYGSMTYAGLMSFLYCNVPKDDPRIQAALKWIKVNYTLDVNPGMDNPYDGLFYHYMVMSKALAAYGDKYIVDSKGRKHHWAAELANKLIELQHPEGYWVNENSSRWMEDNKNLVTAYCMIALDRCRPFLEGE